jgi:hypothetical protein
MKIYSALLRQFSFFSMTVLLIAACGPSPVDKPMATKTILASAPATLTSIPDGVISPTVTSTITPLPTFTSTLTLTPTPTWTPSITPTPTFTFPTFKVIMQAHCRYGPAKAFLHAGDLYSGDSGFVRGRYFLSNWLYVKLDKLDYSCWVAPSVIEVTGDISTLRYTEYNLPGPSILYNPPATVTAIRSGDQVTINWSSVYMTVDDDRGYQLDLFVCQNGTYYWWPVSFPDQYTTTYTITDQAGCSQPSSGRIATVEKHGYSTWISFLWPPP